MAENFEKNIGTLDSAEAPSSYSKYNIRQKLVFAKLISTYPEGQFEFFFLKNLSTFIGTLSYKFSRRLSKLHSTCPDEHFGAKKFQT